MSHHICTRPIPTDLNLRVLLCLQEDLRERLRKMEAGASDKDKVEAPNGIMEICSIFSCTDKCEKRKRTIVRFVLCISWNCMELSRCIPIFLQGNTVWCKDVKGAILPWVSLVDFYERCQARYHYISLHIITIHYISLHTIRLFGNLCVCQLCVDWRYHQIVLRPTSFTQYARASRFW